MNLEIYCDESGIEALSDKTSHKYVAIGGVWISATYRDELKNKVNEIKHRYNVRGELKWNKVSPKYWCRDMTKKRRHTVIAIA